jgi:putative ABC transport system permease protein
MPRLSAVSVAARTLRAQPGFTIVVVLSLALAIALNTTMYSVLDALIHPRIELRDPGQLYVIRLYGDYHMRTSAADRDAALRSGLPSIEAVTSFDAMDRSAILEGGGHVAEGPITAVATNYFDVTGPRLLAGRTFVPSDSSAVTKVTVISEDLADSFFPTAAAAVGATISVNDTKYVVIGVTSRFAQLVGTHTAVWLPSAAQPTGMYARLIRVHDRYTVAAAQRDLDAVAARIALAAREPANAVAFRVHAANQSDFQLQTFHKALISAVLAVLLVACANVANMQLARGLRRQRELAVRAALGASRWRIIAHLLTESGLLALGGLIAGLILTYWSTIALRASIPPSIGAYVVEPRMSWRVLVFAATSTLACVLIVGVFPAIRISQCDPNALLKTGAGTGATRRNRRQYGTLVAVEIALALALLSGTSVMVRSALLFSDDIMGYDVLPLVQGLGGFRTTGERRVLESAALREIADRAGHLPEIMVAAAWTSRRIEGGAVMISDSARGVRRIAAPSYFAKVVTPDYLRTLTRRIVRGRDFMPGERDEPAIIIDEVTAQRLWPASDPIGAMMKLGDVKSKAPFVRIVGVMSTGRSARTAADLLTNSSRLGDVLYLPGAADTIDLRPQDRGIAFVIARAVSDPAAVVIALRRAGFVAVSSLGDDLRRQQASRRFLAALFLLFASLGVGLAAFGIFGVVSHSVAERRREIGVRIALGATARDVLHAILRDSVVIALAGAAVGLLATKYGVMFLRTYAFEDDLYNAPLFAGAAVALLVVAAASAYLPARRATRIDPTEALRSE